MRRTIYVFGLVLCACLAAGCGSSHKKMQQVTGSLGGARIALAVRMAEDADVQAARASDRVFAIFPSTPGKRKCLIPYEGGVHTVKSVFRAVCRTVVRPGPPTVVVFSERWMPCMKGQDCVAGMRMRRHSWLLTMGPLTMPSGNANPKAPVIESSLERGDQPPQGPRP